MNRILSVLILTLTIAYQAGAQHNTYILSSPTEKITLPVILHEISGLTMIDQETFACVQDELGIVFFYNMESKKIIRRIEFEKTGDYEGITEAGNSLYILRSDGLITEIENFRSDDFTLKTHKTNIPAKDNEGLCYDKMNKHLLIGCKSKLDEKWADKNTRAIYGFDLKSNKLSEKPVFEFDVKKLEAFADANNIEMPDKLTKKGDSKEGKLKFKMSAIAIHPLSQKLYILSADDYLLFVMDKNGNPEHVELLDQNLYNKAEGITFLDNGDLLITNEGQDSNPTLLRINKR